MDYQFKFNKILKYIVVFAVIYLAMTYLPSTKNTTQDILMISMIAAIMFAILDIYFPSVIIDKNN